MIVKGRTAIVFDDLAHTEGGITKEMKRNNREKSPVIGFGWERVF